MRNLITLPKAMNSSMFCSGNISDTISPATQPNFADFIISLVAISAVILAFFIDMNTKKKKKKKKKKKCLGVCRDFSSDTAHAEELQFQEALLASSFEQKGLISKSFCEICLEEKEKWQMFKNEGCSHSFCYGCTSTHIKTKVEENAQEIVCPGVNCRALLKADACRNLVPKETLVKWDEALCKSMYAESQRLYCPYRDCSAMLINDTGEDMKQTTCPLCKRSFCVACRVPWHSEFTCKEFKKLGNEDDMTMTLAKKKKWQKCPKCKMLVEKSVGCSHMICRCKHHFCYSCGGCWYALHHELC